MAPASSSALRKAVLLSLKGSSRITWVTSHPSIPQADTEYVVEVGGLVSVPFRIGPFWLERVTYQGAIDFMIDSRHYVGNDRAKCGGSFGWRDDHHFGWELNTLVPQFISNPSAYERMPHQVKYEKPEDKNLWARSNLILTMHRTS